MSEIQLPLPIHQLDDDTLENFYSNNNLLLLNSLRSNFAQLRQPFFFIWGQPSSGKTHLLKAVSNDFLLHQRPAIYVPLKQSHYFSPAVLDNLEYQEAVCLDDIQQVMADPLWEEAIFDLINRIKERGKTLLLMSADQPIKSLTIQLADLISRLNWGEIYQLQPLDDPQKILVLQQKAQQKGFELPLDTANFLLKRLDRDNHTLFSVLEHLDKASLQAQRKLTIPFVKAILDL